MKRITFSFLLAAVIGGASISTTQAANKIIPGSVWNDTNGSHINAHGCCVLFHEGTYYWFGEDRTGYNSNGISCYTSTDLYNWKRVGLVFKVHQANDPETGKCILERPKVIYNDKTGKWVMYIHWEDSTGYGKARVCVATSDRIDGSYEFVSTFRPNLHDSRDQTVFKDTDGKAYHFGSTDMNTNMNVALLSEDYLETEQNPVTETKILNGLKYEAPAIFKVGDIYYGLFSGCTGWNPNPGHTATSTEILGNWTAGSNFAIDEGKETTYKSQSTYVLKVNGYDHAYIYMGDRWNSNKVDASDYVWLPLSIRSGVPTVKWYDSWDLNVFDNADRFKRIGVIKDGAVIQILEKNSDRWMSKSKNGFNIMDDDDEVNLSFELKATDNPYIWRLKEMKTGNFLESVFGSIRLSAENNKVSQEWRFELEEDGCFKIQNSNDEKVLSVSGSSALAGSNLFLAKDGTTSAQSFGFYFDSQAQDYEVADMFSLSYREMNKKRMEEQKEYESHLTGIETVGDSPNSTFKLYPAVNDGNFMIQTGNIAVRMQIVDAGNGKTVFTENISEDEDSMTFLLSGVLSKGIYVISVQSEDTVEIKKMIVVKP